MVAAYLRHLTPVDAAQETLPLLPTRQVCFPSNTINLQCTTPTQRRAIALVMQTFSKELVLCAGEQGNRYGTRAAVEHFDSNTCVARLSCTRRCVISEPSADGVVEVIQTPPDVFDHEQQELVELVTQVHQKLFELHQLILFLDTPIASAILSSLRGTNTGREIPFDPTTLAWFVAAILPLDPEAQAEMLSEDSVGSRLERCVSELELLLEDDGARILALEVVFKKGQTVKYIRTGELAEVVSVHYDDPSGAYLTIKMSSDGRERQTVPSKVVHTMVNTPDELKIALAGISRSSSLEEEQ